MEKWVFIPMVIFKVVTEYPPNKTVEIFSTIQ
jgi:hypothetical protein